MRERALQYRRTRVRERPETDAGEPAVIGCLGGEPSDRNGPGPEAMGNTPRGPAVSISGADGYGCWGIRGS